MNKISLDPEFFPVWEVSSSRRIAAIKLVLDGDAMWSFMLMLLFSMAMDLDLDGVWDVAGMYAPSICSSSFPSLRQFAIFEVVVSLAHLMSDAALCVAY